MLIPKKARWPKKKKAQRPEIELTVEEAGELDWQEQILTAIAGMKSDAFERLSQRILRESGFSRVEVSGQQSSTSSALVTKGP